MERQRRDRLRDNGLGSQLTILGAALRECHHHSQKLLTEIEMGIDRMAFVRLLPRNHPDRIEAVKQQKDVAHVTAMVRGFHTAEMAKWDAGQTVETAKKSSK